MFENLVRDLRLALRALIQRPTVTLLSLLTLAFGIGVVTATFTVVNAVILKPLPYHEPDRLVMVWSANEEAGITVEQQRLGGRSMSPPEFRDWEESSGIFEQLIAFNSWFGTFEDDENPETFFGYQVAPGGLRMLGVEPMLGRGFVAEEEEPGGPQAIVLLYDFWQRRFQGDPAVVGTTVRLNRGPTRIVGVMPPGFVFFSRQAEVVASMPPDARLMEVPRNRRFGRVLGRLAPGLSLKEAQARADVFSAQLAQDYPESNAGWKTELVPLALDSAGPLVPAMQALLAAVLCVLAIMCANIANLMLVQASSRAKDMAVRRALGAGRWRIVRQMLAESLILAIAGAALGR